jgi:hypothetical protein
MIKKIHKIYTEGFSESQLCKLHQFKEKINRHSFTLKNLYKLGQIQLMKPIE